jgi:hypothetical protein
MSSALAKNEYPSAMSKSTAQAASGRWILNSWLDLLLFVSTPLLVVPLIMLIQGPWIGVEVTTIGLIVSAFGGLGHHLPGMIRAYGDRDLFRRFRMRFILAPLFLLAVCVPLSQYHLNAMLLILSVWGCWHALMQVYGFVRIYDVKVGSVASETAWWDWLMCLTWFSTAQVFSNGKMSRLLEYWYTSGGPLISPGYVHAFRWSCLAVSVAVLIGFLVNHVIKTTRGPKPNSIKLLMLLSGISFWWFAMVLVDDIVLGIALFEIFHDVQYLAIVWLYNCRRANSNPDIGGFMKFVFRRSHGMLMLYVGLVFAYGMIAVVSNNMHNESAKTLIRGFVWASTILHFYYDGFIWKVRDNTTRMGLGLDVTRNPLRLPGVTLSELVHLLKWSPFVVVLSWLSFTEFHGTSIADEKTGTRQWPFTTQLDRVLNIAAAVPNDLRAQRRAATTLANLDRKNDAVALLKDLLQRKPTYSEGYQVLGEIHQVNAELDEAAECYKLALANANLNSERSIAYHRLGEVYRQQGRIELAIRTFRRALDYDPKFEGSLQALSEMKQTPEDSAR